MRLIERGAFFRAEKGSDQARRKRQGGYIVLSADCRQYSAKTGPCAPPMNLLNFFAEDGLHLGAVLDDKILDVSAALPGPAYRDLTALLRAENGAWRAVQALCANPGAAPQWPLAVARHAPLLARDCRIFCVGLNYADHAAENNLPPPASPIVFSKLAATITAHCGAVALPAVSQQVDYEAEFACVLGKRLARASESEAARAIAGYTIVNDITARDLQAMDQQWFRSKNGDGFMPMGPWLTTAESIADPNNLTITLRLNGVTRQHSNTRNLFFKPAALAAFLSQTVTLEPGDAISTGTPGGIGYFQKPQVFLRAGDRVEIEVAQIGVLQHSIVALKAGV